MERTFHKHIWVRFEFDAQGYPMWREWDTEKPPEDARGIWVEYRLSGIKEQRQEP